LADDLANDTIEKAILNWKSFEEGTDLKSWLFQIEVGLYRNMRRKDRVRAKSEDPLADSDSIMSVVGETASQHAAAELADVQRIIETLPEDQKSAIYLVCYEGNSAEEAARILDCKVGTLYSRISRARSTLNSVLDGGVPVLEHEVEEVSFRP
jgi:RNA polymerase sigma-70 factor (ECF subfamily)